MEKSPEMGGVAQRPGPSFAQQFVLLVMVVLLGCGNNITKQIAAKPLQSYTYMLGLATSVAYVPLYGGILLLLLQLREVPKSQLNFVWGCRDRADLPAAIFFAFSAFGDAAGDTLGAICTPHVSGPLHSLLSNCTPIFIAGLSMFVLEQRFSLLQCFALLGVLVAVVVGVLPSFEQKNSSTDPFFASVLAGSCIFNAMSFVIKELIFRRYGPWLKLRDEVSSSLSVFVVNSHLAIFQLPFTLLLVPLNELLHQTNGQDIFHYLRGAFGCVFGETADSCGPGSVHAELAGDCVLIYVARLSTLL